MNRREFLAGSAAVLATARPAFALADDAPVYQTSNARWQRTYDKALTVLAGNVRVMPRYPGPVLIEGSSYLGIWMECGPHESLLYRKFRPDVARHSHLTFFTLQAVDGQLPANNKANVDQPGWAQIQMVVPIAATAWDVAKATGDQELLEKAYSSCSRWDNWLMKYRNTRGTGLVEGFCTYDTGMDNSPRWRGMRNNCPDGSARNMPTNPSLPRLCPDLSATTYGARVALAAMAKALGKNDDAARWEEHAATLRNLILQKLYVAEDHAFYDLDAQNKFVKINCDILARVCSEHVPDQTLFDTLWEKQIHRKDGFWPTYPLPSSAMDEPSFVRPIPRNSWGGASQSLTAMRAPRWMDHYGRSAEFAQMMDAWCAALESDGTFRQQIDPVSGAITEAEAPNYSPSALVMITYTWRLVGVHEEGDELWWNVRCNHFAAEDAVFTMKCDNGNQVDLRYVAGAARLSIDERTIAIVTSYGVRVITDGNGNLRALVGISEQESAVEMSAPGRANVHLTLRPNERKVVTPNRMRPMQR
ncbi:MGH1-like glycoside hydrolase domain-containing protein [Terriglobus sp. ADX1]|uniref:MGH1-like glycoside hydrolase domain-containing protein n=1 Tax=Terriglobus sp. ADX1 TaxID=2794063 RepID=UPI002FE66C31